MVCLSVVLVLVLVSLELENGNGSFNLKFAFRALANVRQIEDPCEHVIGHSSP